MRRLSVADRHCCDAVNRYAEPVRCAGTEIDTVAFATIGNRNGQTTAPMADPDPCATRQPGVRGGYAPELKGLAAGRGTPVVPFVINRGGDRTAVCLCRRELLQQCGEYDDCAFHDGDGEVWSVVVAAKRRKH